MLNEMALPANRVAALLRGLEPLQEKVVRLHYGMGCQRAHSAKEIARAFQVSPAVIAGLLGAAQERLAQVGLTPRQLRAAARRSPRV
jgi:DNA-directed RNA polymerase sigma subunit (sigma70/sigma32)